MSYAAVKALSSSVYSIHSIASWPVIFSPDCTYPMWLPLPFHLAAEEHADNLPYLPLDRISHLFPGP